MTYKKRQKRLGMYLTYLKSRKRTTYTTYLERRYLRNAAAAIYVDLEEDY